MNRLYNENMLMKKNGLICLDWDGTLVDSVTGIAESVVKTFSYLALPCPEENMIRSMVGKSQSFITEVYFKNNNALAEKFWIHFRTLYRNHAYPPLRPYVLDFLKKHQDYHIAIVSNNTEEFLIKKIEAFDIGEYIDYIYAADKYLAKPDPIMIQQAMSDANHLETDTWMIGDSEADKEAAGLAKVNFIAVYAEHWNLESCTFKNLIIRKEAEYE